jgi:tRNA (guanine10-N2)-methyltransferase
MVSTTSITITAATSENDSVEATGTAMAMAVEDGTLEPMAHAQPSSEGNDVDVHNNRYLVLVEFVYRHLNFQMAELQSILETYGIRLGSEGCKILPLPVPRVGETKIHSKNRAFTILSFPMNEGPQWSGLLQSHEEQRKNSKFDPRITIQRVGDDGGGGGPIPKTLSIADVLYKCTLVKSVVELWGFSSSDLKDCADKTFRWLNHTSDGDNDGGSGSGISSSFQRDHVWSFVCNEMERPWKFTIHTLGTKVTREEQDAMRQTFRKTLDCFNGPVKLKDPTAQEFLLIREIELDGQGSPLWAKNSNNNNKNSDSDKQVDNTNPSKGERAYCTDAIAYYFGRVLGGRMRNNDGSRGLEHYSLKSRPYLGPTSMDAELSFVMTSLGKVTTGTIVFDPFVGTGSILLSCSMRGAYCIGSDIDIRVIRGKGKNQTIWKNFEHYGLPRPEIVRSDNALYHRHYRHHAHGGSGSGNTNNHSIAPPLYDAIVCDPPYGIRAGARQTGSKLDKPRPVLEENRHDHIAQTKAYAVSDVMSDLLDVAARTIKVGGRLVYIIPSFRDFDEDRDLPRHDCLELVHTCYQPFSTELGRRIVAMVKIADYDMSKREDYRSTIWKFGEESAEKCANIREKIMEAAKEKPGYEEKAAIRKEKRKAHKEVKKKEKKAKRLKEEQQNQQHQDPNKQLVSPTTI